MVHHFCCSADGGEHNSTHINWGTMLLIAVLIMSGIGLTPRHTANDAASQVDNAANMMLSKDCAVLQRTMYEPCQHQMTRRVSLPAELAGQRRTDAEAYYTGWQITSYSSSEIQMERTLTMYCPQHTVLMPDESGILCIWQNTYGDALSLVKELSTPISDFDDDQQQLLRAGMGFDTMDALNQWLESAES